MAKKKEDYNPFKKIPFQELDVLETNYIEKIKTDPKYSLDVDPLNHYDMTIEQKDFIRNYVQFKNVPLAAQLTGIDEGLATEYWQMYSSQQEIRRINLAMYHRQFATKMIGIDEIGGYLTSLLMDENVPIVERLKTKEKLDVIKLILDVNKLKQNAMSQPEYIDAVSIEEQLKDLNVETIQRMIAVSGDPKTIEEKEKIIQQIKWENDKLTPEELSTLKAMPIDELNKMLEQLKKSNKEKEIKVIEEVKEKEDEVVEEVKENTLI